jgi:hypothetical protein
LLLAVLGLASPAPASTPSLVWQGASKLRVQCLVQTESGASTSALQSALCDRVAKLAARGAPVPVSVIGFGDPDILAPGTVALLVHASVTANGSRRLLAFTIRPFRASVQQTEVLFGAAPRAVSLPASAAGASLQFGPTVDASVASALAETLPWLAGPNTSRPIPPRS